MSSVAASSSSSSPSPSSSSSSSSIVVMHVDMSDMRPILKEAFGKNVEIATISNNGLIPAKYLYEGLQNYTEGIVANHGGGGGDDEDAQRTADGVTAIKKNIGIVLKEILNDNLRTALTPFDRDGDGTIDAEELQQAAKDHQTVLMSRKILAWFSFVLLLFMIIVCGGLSVGIYYIVFSLKDTYVNPSTGLMMVKAPDGSTNTNSAGIGIELPTRTLGQGVTITSQGTMDGRTCYSSDSVANMFVNVATGVTTSLAETNQETDELHIYHLGNSDCDESNIVWSNKDVQLGCVVMVPSLECTNMVRRGRYLSEFADTDAMQDRHRSLKEHVANMIVGATTGGHGTSTDRSNRNLQDGSDDIAYANANDDGSEAAVTWKKYDATDCEGKKTWKYFSGKKEDYTVEEMLAECKSTCADNEACVGFNFQDDREHPDHQSWDSSHTSKCNFFSAITDTPDAVDSKDCWVSSKTNYDSDSSSNSGCRAKKDNVVRAKDSNCAPCENGYKWWPCNLNPPMCEGTGCPWTVKWKKYDATDCKGAHTRIDGSKYFGGSQRKWQTEYTVDEMLAECKSKCANNEACVAFNFRDNREQPEYTFGGSSCKWWSTITDTPDAVGDSKDCWVSSKTNFGQPTFAPTPNPSRVPTTQRPTPNPTPWPIFVWTRNPTPKPTFAPSNSQSPSSLPSSSPSTSDAPSNKPSELPSGKPSSSPSNAPSNKPSELPSGKPSSSPSNAPSDSPSELPSSKPSGKPSSSPSNTPSNKPSESPSGKPSSIPSNAPSDSPSELPSSKPSGEPSGGPSNSPSSSPSSVCDLEWAKMEQEWLVGIDDYITKEKGLQLISETSDSKTNQKRGNSEDSLAIARIDPDPTSQCNAKDGKLAFLSCRCNELTILEDYLCREQIIVNDICSWHPITKPPTPSPSPTRRCIELAVLKKNICSEQIVLKNNICSKVGAIDCVGGYERGGTGLTCEKACDGDCCVGGTEFGQKKPACGGFTGVVHRDGSCYGRTACKSATIGEVKGPSCTGDYPCEYLKSSLVTESCNGWRICYKSEVSLIEGSCNGPRYEREYDCDQMIATSIVDEQFYPPQKSICRAKCESAYNAAGKDGTKKGILSCSDDVALWTLQPNFCRFINCDERCIQLFPIFPRKQSKNKYSASCNADDSCLNLDFYCVASKATCELECLGRNSCNGLTMYCADNQACAINNCGDGTERCVGAKVIYNSEKKIGLNQYSSYRGGRYVWT